MFHELRKYLQEVRDDYKRLTWADIVIVALFLAAVLGLLYGIDEVVKRMQ